MTGLRTHRVTVKFNVHYQRCVLTVLGCIHRWIYFPGWINHIINGEDISIRTGFSIIQFIERDPLDPAGVVLQIWRQVTYELCASLVVRTRSDICSSNLC